MKKALVLIFALSTCISLSAQETIFSKNGLGFSGIWGGVSYNFSYFDTDSDISYLRGGNIGLEFGRSVLIGWSWDRLREQVELDDINESFNMRYSGLMIDYYPGSEKVVHPRFGVVLGGGKLNFSDGGDDRVFVLQPSAGVEINIFKWFRLGLEGGYRLVSGVDFPDIDSSDISAPYAQLDLRFGISWGSYRSKKRNRNRNNDRWD